MSALSFGLPPSLLKVGDSIVDVQCWCNYLEALLSSYLFWIKNMYLEELTGNSLHNLGLMTKKDPKSNQQ